MNRKQCSLCGTDFIIEDGIATHVTPDGLDNYEADANHKAMSLLPKRIMTASKRKKLLLALCSSADNAAETHYEILYFRTHFRTGRRA